MAEKGGNATSQHFLLLPATLFVRTTTFQKVPLSGL